MKKIFVISYLIIQLLNGWSQVDSLDIVAIDNIIIEGNRKTKSQIITRELSFTEGSQYQRSQLDSMFEWDRNRIYNTNLFNDVSFSLINASNGKADVLITVDERWYFHPIPIFQLAGRNFNDWWVNRNRDLNQVSIGLKLTQYNFRGRLERLRVNSQFGFTTRINFSYRIPYIEKTKKHGLDLDFNYLETKYLAFDTEHNNRIFIEGEGLLRSVFRNRITHSYRSSFYSFHFLSLGNTSVNIADTVATLNLNYLGDGLTNQKYFTAGYSYSWDRRDNRNYPTKGEWHTGRVRKYGLGFYKDVDFWTTEFGLSKYKELEKDFYYAGNLIGVISFPNERSYFNYFAIGFRKTVLRGHDLTIVEGSDFFVQKNEFKKKLFSHKQDISKLVPIRQFQTFPITIFGKIFFDQGYAKSYPGHNGSDLLADQYLYSYGLGIDLMIIYDAVFRFELSHNTLGKTNFFLNFGTAL